MSLERRAGRHRTWGQDHRSGVLRITIRTTFPLEKMVDAHRDVETGHGRGKVVITVGR